MKGRESEVRADKKQTLKPTKPIITHRKKTKEEEEDEEGCKG